MEKLLILLFFVGSFGHVFGAEFGQPCPNGNECASSVKELLKCNTETGKCVCADGLFRHLDLQACLSYEGQSCTLRDDDGAAQFIKKCTPYATCYPDPTATTTTTQASVLANPEGKCHCSNSEHDDISKECKLSHGGMDCTSDTNCLVAKGLTCQEGKCVCHDEENQIWTSDENGEQKCISLVGGSCEPSNRYPAPPCGDHMSCNGTIPSRTCQCNNGYLPNPDKTCGLEHGKECNDTLPCHVGFRCISGKCDCMEGQNYEDNTCKIQPERSCSNNETDALQCVKNANCISGVCKCNSDYKASPEGDKCLGTYNADCHPTDMPCNFAEYFVCPENGTKCECAVGYEWDGTLRQCRGTFGQPCNPERTRDCVGNLVCPAVENPNCTCPNGYLQRPDSDRTCEGTFGASCGSEGLDCSRSKFLACSSSTQSCDCIDANSQLHEDGSDHCVAKAGESCKESADGIECVTDATCMNSSPKVCQCNTDYGKAENGTCVKGNGAANIVASGAVLLAAVMVGVVRNFN